MLYTPNIELERAVKEYKRIKSQLENKEQIESIPPSENEKSLVYYIDHLKYWIEQQDAKIADMSEVFNGIRRYTKY